MACKNLSFKKIFFAIIFFSIYNKFLFAQFDEYYPHLKWKTIKREKIEVHFHEGSERTALITAKVAEEVWGPITSLYEYEPDKVHFIIKDIDDYSNGLTNFIDNTIEIWASAMDFDLRGTHNWLRNVITHEFTHMVHLQAAMKFGRRIPAFSFQFLNYEQKRRPDILYGFPNVVAVYPLATINVPSWFAEGVAQYQRKEFDYDDWDSHRDMILRCFALEDKMLTYEEMGVFGKNSLGSEAVYNSGFALTLYISQKYGEDKLSELTKSLGKFFNFNFDAACKQVLGKSGKELYSEWKNYIVNSYKERSKGIFQKNISGDLIVKEGYANFYPKYDSIGNKIFYLSNKNKDYLSQTSLYAYDLNLKTSTLISDGIKSNYAISKDGKKIYFAKLTQKNEHWANIHDIFVYDIEKKEEKRLTFGARANQIALSNDGNLIAFVWQKDGTANLSLYRLSDNSIETITAFKNGEQIYNPVFSPVDEYLYFDFASYKERDIARISLKDKKFEYFLKTPNDERNLFFDCKGNIYYSSDATGIFNIYKMRSNDSALVQVTNVIGGAFMGCSIKEDQIVYAGFNADGYKIYLLNADVKEKIEMKNNYVKIINPPLGEDKPKGDLIKFNLAALQNFNDFENPYFEVVDYRGAFTKFIFFPLIRIDNYTTSNNFVDRIKPGIAGLSEDILKRYSLFFNASINKLFERDIYFSFDYRNKLPVLYSFGLKPDLSLEIFSVSRKAKADLLIGKNIVNGVEVYDYQIPVDVTYNLFETSLTFKNKIFNRLNNLDFKFTFSRYSSTLGSFLLPPDNIFIPASSDVYFIGRSIELKYDFELEERYLHSDINPSKTFIDLRLSYELNKFNPDGNYEVKDGILKPLYQNFTFPKIDLNLGASIQFLKSHVISAKTRAAFIFGPKVPDFFDFYLGGLVGMKSYPFYSISGNELLWVNLSYYFPILSHIDYKLAQFYLDKIFGGIYFDYGNAWNEKFPSFKEFKKGIGSELRIKLISYYIFPTSVFFNAAYSFDRFERQTRGKTILYGKEWLFYAGVLYEFVF